MDKSIIETFVKRYSLNGECEKAHWYSDSAKEKLVARAHTETKSVMLKVVMKNWKGTKACELALPSSTKIKSMLAPLGPEVVFTLNELRDRVISVTISDADCEAICTVADYDAFPETPDIDEHEATTDFEIEIVMDAEFKERFLRSVAALSDARDFVLMNNRQKTLDMIINYEDTNTNRIRLPLKTTEGKDQIVNPVGFSTPVLKSILAAHPDPVIPKKKAKKDDDAPDGDAADEVVVAPTILRASGNGMAELQFEDENFISKYWMFSTRILD